MHEDDVALIELEHCQGNKWADTLAKCAANKCLPPETVIETYRNSFDDAVSFYRGVAHVLGLLGFCYRGFCFRSADRVQRLEAGQHKPRTPHAFSVLPGGGVVCLRCWVRSRAPKGIAALRRKPCVPLQKAQLVSLEHHMRLGHSLRWARFQETDMGLNVCTKCACHSMLSRACGGVQTEGGGQARDQEPATPGLPPNQTVVLCFGFEGRLCLASGFLPGHWAPERATTVER